MQSNEAARLRFSVRGVSVKKRRQIKTVKIATSCDLKKKKKKNPRNVSEYEKKRAAMRGKINKTNNE